MNCHVTLPGAEEYLHHGNADTTRAFKVPSISLAAILGCEVKESRKMSKMSKSVSLKETTSS